LHSGTASVELIVATDRAIPSRYINSLFC